MGLSTAQAGSTSGSGIKITDGVYANLKTIEKVRDLSGKKIEHINDKSFDLALEIEFSDDRFPQLFFGNLKTDASGEVESWGGAFIVALLFENTESTAELNEHNRFNPEDIRALVGKKLYTVSYTAGTYKSKDGKTGTQYRTWNQTFPVMEDEEELASEILDAWHRSRDKGYPKDYELPKGKSSGGGLSTGSGRSGAKKSSVTESIELGDDFDDMDDDLPF